MAIVLRGLAAAFMMAISAIASAHADSVADFYKGRTISVVVGGSAGGGYDALARLVARYLGKYVPGHPGVIVQDMPGAGGIVSMNYIANTAPQDGTVIGSPTANTPFEPLYGTSQALYDPMKLNWLGTPSPETSILTIWNTVPVNSIADARTHVIRVGVTGANSTSAFYAKLLNETLGFQEQLILGFPGQNDAFIAMERGEIDGEPDAFYSSIMATRPTWIPEKKVKLLVQMGGAPLKAIPDVPFAPDLAANDADRRFIEEACAPIAIGRPYVTGPGVPVDRVKALQIALLAAFHDPELRAEAAKEQLTVDDPKSGEEIAAIIHKTYVSPPEDVIRLRNLSSR